MVTYGCFGECKNTRYLFYKQILNVYFYFLKREPSVKTSASEKGKIILGSINRVIKGHFPGLFDNWMGGYLSQKYANQYFSIGFLTNEGNYTDGLGNNISTKNKLIKGKPGSFEYNFNKTENPYFYFDLSFIYKNEPNSLWLDKKLDQRIIGADATDEQFFPTLLKKKFDAIIFINSTTATKTFLPTDEHTN